MAADSKVQSIPTDRMDMWEAAYALCDKIKSGKVKGFAIAIVEQGGDDSGGDTVSTVYHQNGVYFTLAGAVTWLQKRLMDD